MNSQLMRIDYFSATGKTRVSQKLELNLGTGPCFSASLVTGGSSVTLSFWVFSF